MIEFPKILKKGDITLKKLEPTFANCKIMFDLIDKNRKFFRQWLNGWIDDMKRPEDEFDSLKKGYKDDSGGGYRIFYKNTLVGSADFVAVNEKAKNAEIGYFLAEEYNGKGIVTRSVQILEDFAFGKLGFERIVIRNDTRNEKSAAIPKRLGYNLDGIMRRDMYGRAAADKNKFRDTNVWSKLKSEWKKENAKRSK